MIKRVAKYLINLLKYIRSGGFVTVNIAKIDYGTMLAGRNVLITGGSSGFGYAMADKFLSLGADVMITGRNKEKLDKALLQLKSQHGNRVKAMAWDLDKTAEIPDIFTKAIVLGGAFDTFINNAGICRDSKFLESTIEKYDQIMETNLKGLFFLMQEEAKYLERTHTYGKIINTTSVCGIIPSFDAYHASKWGANCITMGMAKRLAQKGIIVNAIAPGEALTDIKPEFKDARLENNEYCPNHPTQRYIRVEEIAELAAFLASDAANNIVGQVIAVDGGWTVRK